MRLRFLILLQVVHPVRQDLSVAGKRKGLAGERSGLFMEQVRLTKELREQDVKTNGHLGMDVMPRYSVWENVTGALSSNNGEDFRAVLEETARIAEEGVSIPGLEKGQKWSNAGAICGDGWSIAWRVHDAQYWGVPQRRKRVCVLADFNGHTAADILFECFRKTDSDDTYEVIGNTGRQPRSEIYAFRESVSGNPSQSEREGKEVAGSVGESSDSASYTLKIRGGR
jgi:DNA (cytosine-5)-methyltransferase 1